MKFEDLTREQIAEYACSNNPFVQILMMDQPSLLVSLLHELGAAKAAADHIALHMEMADTAIKTGAARMEPLHTDLDASIRASVESTMVCFETVLDAVMLANETAKSCKCIGCTRRRQVEVAETN